jgi:hypothetical protein
LTALAALLARLPRRLAKDTATKMLTQDEIRQMAVNFARPSELLVKRLGIAPVSRRVRLPAAILGDWQCTRLC